MIVRHATLTDLPWLRKLYADFAAETVAVQVPGQWKRARLYRSDGSVVELQTYPVREGSGIDIDRIEAAATLRVDQ